MCTLFKCDVVTLIELVESSPCLWEKLLIVLKTKYKNRGLERSLAYVVLEEELDRDKKEQQNTVCNTIYQKIKSMYAHEEVIIKFGVVISSFSKRV